MLRSGRGLAEQRVTEWSTSASHRSRVSSFEFGANLDPAKTSEFDRPAATTAPATRYKHSEARRERSASAQ